MKTMVALLFRAAAALALAPTPFMVAVVAPLLAFAGAAAGRINCTRSCGNISIPYPFGVEPGCYIEPGFNLTCNLSHRRPILFLGDGTVQILSIDINHGTVRINGSAAGWLGSGVTVAEIKDIDHKYGGNSPINASSTWGGALGDGGQYTLAEGKNKLLVGGCNVQVLLVGPRNKTVSTCSTFCNQLPNDGEIVFTDKCSGLGCCDAEILLGYNSYGFQVLWNNDSSQQVVGACIVESEFRIVPGDLTYMPGTLPAVLDWRMNHTTCHGNASSAACRSSHSFCQNSTRLQDSIPNGHLCHCTPGYQGNPYVVNGCHDINECESPEIYRCYGACSNKDGGYQCSCLPGYEGNASVSNGCKDINECAHPDRYSCYGICTDMLGTFSCHCKNGTYGNPFTKGGCSSRSSAWKFGLGVGIGLSCLFVTLGTPLITHKIKLHQVKRRKERFFKKNHGLLLQQLVSRQSDIGGRMVINLRDLEKATNNFNPSHEIGGGGHGVVYKGLLNLQVVAIKKSKIIVQQEIDEFINEVIILSQINHRNIVKLLGCCLETEVPLLVYEFISNGTLDQHLHAEGLTSLLWDDRLRIALEVSKALAYLHSATSTPILHRDIKLSNILLDDNLIAKVSDFGASKSIPIDKTGVTTAVQGTIGYLDPMYYYKGRLTDKSDVFSFGVLLIELLTRKKPYVYRSNDGDSLVSHFTSLLAKGSLSDIIDPQIIDQAEGEQVIGFATLAAKCTKLNGEDRPTMREVEMSLETLRGTKKHVHHNTTQRRYDSYQAAARCLAFDGLAVETSGQYTIEGEILSSASYPR